MNRIAFGLLFATLTTHTGFGSIGHRGHSTIRPLTTVAGIELGGLSGEEAARRLRVWWESEKLKTLEITCPAIKKTLPKLKPNEFGITLDDVATVAKLPTTDAANVNEATHDFEPVYKSFEFPPSKLTSVINAALGTPRPARAIIYKGSIVREPEVVKGDFTDASLLDAVATAIKGSTAVQLPMEFGPKRISDADLNQITDVVFSFSTRFPKRQYSRNSNIKLASSKLNGVILLPNERLSFNGTVGERTIAKGFKLAGVYKNGKHDTGIGGGICQVSTTLYNACIFSDLKIIRRSNHSMPVAYVPLGRDATVDFGNLDLVIQNDKPYPIAISSAFVPGMLTFRVLGKKDPGLTVKLMQEGGKSWDMGTRTVQDPKLPPGERNVIEKGSRGHSITTYRLVYKNGVLVDKHLLNRSYYGGGERIVAVGPTAPAPLATGGVVQAVTTNPGVGRGH